LQIYAGFLAGAISQKNLQVFGTNAYVFSMELSMFSIFFMLVSLLIGSPDGKRLRSESVFEGWTWKTWIPVISNSFGGVIVGLVTKYAGAVRKGFALIFGLLLSGILQNFVFARDEKLTKEQVVGGILACFSLWMHSTYTP
jgi:solute carrier family 35 (UDP-sugar transporter), member A1/2/3